MTPVPLSHNGYILNRAVLVLNANYAPLHICTAKRAICLHYLEKIEIIESYKEKIHSPSVQVPVPSVIKLRQIVKYNSMAVILNRKNIFQRDNYTCQYCGTSSGSLTLDHIIPKEQGGDDVWENLVTACLQCNLKKGNHSPEAAGLQLQKKPNRPNRIQYFQQFAKNGQGSWKPYLFMEALR